MSVNIPELQGSFQRLYNVICTCQPSTHFVRHFAWCCLPVQIFSMCADPRNVTEFTYRMSSQKDKTARICMSIQTKSHDEFVDVVNSINAQDGMHATDLADNELAKSHLRHLAGGRAEDVRPKQIVDGISWW